MKKGKEKLGELKKGIEIGWKLSLSIEYYYTAFNT